MSENDNDNMSLEDALRAIADVEGIENPVLEIEVEDEDEPPSVEVIEETEILGFVPHFNCRCVVRKAIDEPPSVVVDNERTPPMRKIKKSDFDFYCGVITALAVLAEADQQSLYDEILKGMDIGELVEVARLNDEISFSGLLRYGYATKDGVLSPDDSNCV